MVLELVINRAMKNYEIPVDFFGFTGSVFLHSLRVCADGMRSKKILFLPEKHLNAVSNSNYHELPCLNAS